MGSAEERAELSAKEATWVHRLPQSIMLTLCNQGPGTNQTVAVLHFSCLISEDDLPCLSANDHLLHSTVYLHVCYNPVK